MPDEIFLTKLAFGPLAKTENLPQSVQEKRVSLAGLALDEIKCVARLMERLEISYGGRPLDLELLSFF